MSQSLGFGFPSTSASGNMENKFEISPVYISPALHYFIQRDHLFTTYTLSLLSDSNPFPQIVTITLVVFCYSHGSMSCSI